MGTAWEYSTDPNAEHDAIREAAGMFDMSPLKKIHVTGPDATRTGDSAHDPYVVDVKGRRRLG